MPRLIGIKFVLFALLCSFQAFADATLKVGDPAPEIKIEKWFNGEGLKSFERGKVYVVEFWATWCGPCIGEIPHLNEIAKKYAKDVVVVGIDGYEKGGTAEQKLEKVANFLKTNNPVQEYLIGFDSTSDTYEKWQRASESQGIPNVYIIDRDGTIAFIGHPVYMDLEQIGNPLKQIVEGTWKDSKERAKFEEDQRTQKEQQKVARDLQNRFDEAAKADNWEGALQVAIEGSAQPNGLGTFYTRMQADLLIDNLSRPAEGLEILKNMLKDSWNSAGNLSPILELFMNPKLKETPHYKVAIEHAYQINKRLLVLIEGDGKDKKHDWFYYPKVAQYYFAIGELTKAIEYQKLALSKLPEDSKKHYLQEFEEQLATFEKAQPAPTATTADTVVCKDGVCEIAPAVDCENKLAKKY